MTTTTETQARPRRSTASTSRPTPEAIWDAITKPEWTERYGYGGLADYDLRPGGRAITRTRRRRCAPTRACRT